MRGKPKKGPRVKDLTSRYRDGELDEDRLDQNQKFSQRNKHQQQNKILRTALMRAAEEEVQIDKSTLLAGQVIQVHSLFCEVEHGGMVYLCVVRKTMMKVAGTSVIVGDEVRIRPTGSTDEAGRPEAVVEEILPRRTILTRADSFKAIVSHPIVANAQQMMIVASLAEPKVKWGLIDRMIIAARSGGLVPIICLNKIDLAERFGEEAEFADAALKHYATMEVRSIRTSVSNREGLNAVREILRDKTTVLAGHSGVGKSSLINAIQPALDLRVGAVSGFNEKGRHTTTSARRYVLDFGGAVIDTPGVKLFGLWNVTRENLGEYFEDVEEGTAPQWRKESFERIKASLE